MKKYLLTLSLIACILAMNCAGFAYTVTQYKNVPTRNYDNVNNIYNNDLSHVERYLFNRTFTKENNISRINRIENELFNKTYGSMSFSNRMNNVLANYQNQYNRGYYNANNTGYYTTNSTLKNRIINNLVGQPTGYTPPLRYPYMNGFNRSYNGSYYGTNGWGYHNSYRPTYGGMGVHILD